MYPIEEKVLDILKVYVGNITARTILRTCAQRARANLRQPKKGDRTRLVVELERTTRIFIKERSSWEKCHQRLRTAASASNSTCSRVIDHATSPASAATN